MLECIELLFKFAVALVAKLFTIDVGFTNLGTVFCIVYILLPVIVMIVSSAKHESITLVAKEYRSNEKRYR